MIKDNQSGTFSCPCEVRLTAITSSLFQEREVTGKTKQSISNLFSFEGEEPGMQRLSK